MPPFRNAKEIASKIHMSVWWVYQLAKRGRIPAHRVSPRGRLMFIEEEVLDALCPKLRPELRTKLLDKYLDKAA